MDTEQAPPRYEELYGYSVQTIHVEMDTEQALPRYEELYEYSVQTIHVEKDTEQPCPSRLRWITELYGYSVQTIYVEIDNEQALLRYDELFGCQAMVNCLDTVQLVVHYVNNSILF